MGLSRRPASAHDPAASAARRPAAAAIRPSGRFAVAYGWRPAAALIGLAAVVLGVVFRHDVAAATKVWVESTAYNHCFLILPLVGFLLWERRAVFASASPSPVFWPLLAMPVLSSVWLVAAVLDLNEGRQLAVVAMFQIVLLVALGPGLFRLLLAPLLFLFFLVPSGAFLVPNLQNITADIAVWGLQALHIPVFSDGFMIQIPEGSFEIAEACAGLRFLVASSVFGCFFAVVMYRSFVRRALFIALSVAVPIAANGMRALGIIWLAHLEGSATAVEADHVLYGWLFFSLVILLLIALGMAFVDKGERAPVGPVPPTATASPWRCVTAVLAAILLAAVGPAYAARLDAGFEGSALPAAVNPRVDPPWQIRSDPDIRWRPVVRGADRESLQSFAAPGSGVVVRYLALYRLRVVGNALTNTDNRMADDHAWRVAQQGSTVLSLDGDAIRVTSTQIVSGPYRRLVWSFYVVDGKIVSGLLRTKLLQARAVLLQRAPIAALVAISASMDDPADPAAGQLRSFLRASQPLPQRLDRASREAGSAPPQAAGTGRR